MTRAINPDYGFQDAVAVLSLAALRCNYPLNQWLIENDERIPPEIWGRLKQRFI